MHDAMLDYSGLARNRSINYPAAGNRSIDYPAAGNRSINYLAAGNRSIKNPAAGNRRTNYPAAGSRSINYPATGNRSINYPAAGNRSNNCFASPDHIRALEASASDSGVSVSAPASTFFLKNLGFGRGKCCRFLKFDVAAGGRPFGCASMRFPIKAAPACRNAVVFRNWRAAARRDAAARTQRRLQ